MLVSSHILGEVEQVADTVSIIGHGRLLASGPVARGDRPAGRDLGAGGRRRPGRRRAGAAEGGLSVRRDAGLLLVDGVPDPADVTRRLAHHELYVNELVPVRADLESVFLQLTGPESLEADLRRRTEGAPMTRLARVELRRLLRRRLTLFVVLGILLAVGLQVFQTGMQAAADVRQRAGPGHRRLRARATGLRPERRAAAPGLPAGPGGGAGTGDATADFGCDTMEPTLAMIPQAAAELRR